MLAWPPACPLFGEKTPKRFLVASNYLALGRPRGWIVFFFLGGVFLAYPTSVARASCSTNCLHHVNPRSVSLVDLAAQVGAGRYPCDPGCPFLPQLKPNFCLRIQRFAQCFRWSPEMPFQALALHNRPRRFPFLHELQSNPPCPSPPPIRHSPFGCLH